MCRICMRRNKYMFLVFAPRGDISSKTQYCYLLYFPFFCQFGRSYLTIDHVDKPTKEVSSGAARTGSLTSLPPTNAAYSV